MKIMTFLQKQTQQKTNSRYIISLVISRPLVYTRGMSIKEHSLKNQEYKLHVPVLLDSVLKLLNPQPGENYLDLTAGYGGHAGSILELTHNYQDSVLVDRDENAIQELGKFRKSGARLIHDDFVSAAKTLIDEERKFNLILIDLGVSSPQLDQSRRGFSFLHNGPLDMRMDPRQKISAKDIVNSYSEKKLAEIIVKYGEEKVGFANRIAKEIVKQRPLSTTSELADLVVNIHRGKWQKTHPATRTFQALRIEVNQELRQVETVLPLLLNLLHQNGRVGVISFHSLEDRLVKKFFKQQAQAGYEASLELITKKAIDGANYDVHNPRARSAKLRVALKK